MSKPVRGPVPAACLTVAIGLLFVSCDKNRVPTEPTPVPGPRSTGPIAFVSDRDGTEAVYLANEDGSVVTRLSDGRSPAWSSDGGKIALWRPQDIYVINVDGSGLQRLFGGWEPDWSPDGRLIAFRYITETIFAAEVDGSNRRRLYESEYGAFGPDWSPDGQRIVFAVGSFVEDCPLGLWVMNADGSGPQCIGVSDGWAPAWSPDGSQIAFISHAGIGIVSPDGSARRLQVAGNIADVEWTPDGRLIYTRSAGGGRRIFISEGGVERQLIPEATAPLRAAYHDMDVVWRR
jgi:Tol biopolymer transport system component